MQLAIVDTSAVYAALDVREQSHRDCAEALLQSDFQIVFPALVVAEACYLVGSRLGAPAEAAFVASLAENDVRAPMAADWPRIGELVRQYSDFPLGAVDASVIALAERLETDIVITLDRRHFSAVRPRHCEHLRLLPQ